MHLSTVFVAVSLFFHLAVGSHYKLVCYVSSWSQYRPGVVRFTPDKADPFLCSHIIFAFADIDESYVIRAAEVADEDLYRSLNVLKQRNPALKTLLSVGGWNLNSKLAKMASKHSHRTKFVSSVLRFLRFHGFDGLDVVWQDPGAFGGEHRARKHFTHLLKELHVGFNEEALLLTKRHKLLLSTAVSGLEEYAREAYNTHTFPQYADFISLMTYDFQGPWQRVTSHTSPLYSHTHDPRDQELNINHAVKYWLSQGVEPRKLILGFPAYSRTFQLKGNGSHGMGVPAQEGHAGKYTKTPGFMASYEVCQLIRSGAVIKWDRKQKVPYAIKGNQWVGFDDGHSLRKKTEWLRRQGLGGAMVWSMDLDDFTGTLCKHGTFPLIRLLKKSLLARHRGYHHHKLGASHASWRKGHQAVKHSASISSLSPFAFLKTH
ncbi:chitinase-3-like protein 1 [Amia ocellicauda]|uniref:chitinase-3-like protein 1 n=1 Tax=Amia ocellicauda TaxID=2972642 RepID=UPI003464B9B2